MERYLIVKTSSLGDIIQCFPAISYLKNVRPNAEIDWVVEKPFVDLVSAHPDVTRAICVDTKKWRNALFSSISRQEIKCFRNELKKFEYDAVFDLQSNFKSGIITWQARSEVKVGFASKTVHERPNLLFTNVRYDYPPGKNIREDYLSLLQQHFKVDKEIESSYVILNITQEQKDLIHNLLSQRELQGKKLVMVCPGAAWMNKQLTPETLIQFLKLLHHKMNCAYLVIWGNDKEKELATTIVNQFSGNAIVVPRLKLGVLQNLMAKMDLVVAMDSLPLHLAGTTGVHTFSIFGSSLAKKFMPLGLEHTAFQGTCPYGKTFEKRCPILRTCSTGACVHTIKPQDLINTIKS
jgi:heptosyltransferase-1